MGSLRKIETAVSTKETNIAYLPSVEQAAEPKQDQLGQTLRQIYSDVLAEPVPDQMRSLLDQLDEATGTAAEAPRTAAARGRAGS